MEDFERKVSISGPETTTTTMEIQVEDEKGSKTNSSSGTIVGLLRRFLAVQQRRALAYARLKRYGHCLSSLCVWVCVIVLVYCSIFEFVNYYKSSGCAVVVITVFCLCVFVKTSKWGIHIRKISIKDPYT